MKAILACDALGGMGYQNRLPWPRVDGDLPRFRQLTEHQIVLMGSKTWESLPVKPLPKRLNVVVTSRKLELPDGAMQVSNPEYFANFSNCWMIGGGDLLKRSWNLLTEIHLTRLLAIYTCDVQLDLIQLSKDFDCKPVSSTNEYSYEIWSRKIKNETISGIVTGHPG